MNKLYLETDRLIITEFEESMVESVHLNSLDEDNRRFMPDEIFETADDARQTVNKLISNYSSSAAGPLVYPVLLKDGHYLGHVEIVPIKKGWEIGYHIGKIYSKCGYATEAVVAFIPYMMKKLSISEIYGVCRADNIASRKVLEKSGFILEFDGIGSYHGGEYHIRKYIFRS